MTVIVIPVSKNRPEDDILNLVEILASQFKENSIKVSNALVLETDLPEAANLFRKIAGTEIPMNSNSKAAKYECVECGAPVSHKNAKCRSCSQRARSAKKATQEETDNEGELA
jgi:predicted RNA-binding Zn-ribbon protein involved in translation (DUF1610 family)